MTNSQMTNGRTPIETACREIVALVRRIEGEERLRRMLEEQIRNLAAKSRRRMIEWARQIRRMETLSERKF